MKPGSQRRSSVLGSRFSAVGALLCVLGSAAAACSTRGAEPQTQPDPAPNQSPSPLDPTPAPDPDPRPAAVFSSTPAPFLAGATRVVAFTTPGGARIAAAGPGYLRVHDTTGKLVTEASATGDAHVLEAIDVDGDGGAELVVGRGESRLTRGAPMSVVVLHPDDLEKVETIPLRKTARPQVVGVTPASPRPGDLYVAAFESKYFARIVRARRAADGTWSAQDHSAVRVPGGIAALPDGRLAIARMYGDTGEQDGDLRVWSGKSAVTVPTLRGVRAVVSHDGALVFTDGWHRDYGNKARARITRAVESGDTWTSTVIADVPGRWGYDRLRIGDTDGDGAPEAIAAGNGPAVVIPLSGPDMGKVTTLGDTDATDAFPADLDQDGADEVIVLGPSPSIWRREAAPAR